MGKISSPDHPDGCPSWCALRHGQLVGEDDSLHVGAALLVKRTVLRLCASIDTGTGAVDGPHVMVASADYSLHEAELLIAALTQLVEQGRQVSRCEGA